MCEMVGPSTLRSARVVCAADIKTKMIDKTAIEIIRSKYKSPIRLKIFKVQEGLLKSINKFIVRWEW